MILRLPAAVAVTVTEQLPDDSVQVFEGDVMLPFPETVKVTVPVCDGYPPDAVAVQVIGVPMPKGDGVHDKVVAVGAFLTVSVVVLELR